MTRQKLKIHKILTLTFTKKRSLVGLVTSLHALLTHAISALHFYEDFTLISWLLDNFNNSSRCQFHQRFYVQIFRTTGVSAAFSSYVLALAKNSYKKCARLTLIKLTLGVNFINVFLHTFLYESLFSSNLFGFEQTFV